MLICPTHNIYPDLFPRLQMDLLHIWYYGTDLEQWVEIERAVCCIKLELIQNQQKLNVANVEINLLDFTPIQ